MLRRDGRISPATTPFIRADQRAQIAAYIRLPAPKALALGPEDEAIGSGTGATPEAARQAALAACATSRPPCIVYAENDRIVLGYP
jgi:hypothetical protein